MDTVQILEQKATDLLSTALIDKQYYEKTNIKRLLVDNELLRYLICVYSVIDYDNTTSLATLLRIVSPILTNYKLTENDNQSAEFLEQIFSKMNLIYQSLNINKNNKLQQQISGNIMLEEEEHYKKLFNEMQKYRDLSQLQMNYMLQKNHEKAMKKEAKRIAKGKSIYQDKINEIKQQEQQQDHKQVAQISQGGNKSQTNAIELINVTLAFGSNVLLTNANAHLNYGNRYCLIGKNGCGKSALCKAIYNGELNCIKDVQNQKVIYVSQECPSSDDIVIDVVLSADQEYTYLNNLYNQLQEVVDGQPSNEKLDNQIKELLKQNNYKIQDNNILDEEDYETALEIVLNQMSEGDFFQKRSQAIQILNGLRFTYAMQNYKTKQLSGGWRMRVSLARALFSQPTILILDEPTNNLDLLAELWLEDWLCKFDKKGLLLVVSHDISFINTIATHVIQLANKDLRIFSGNYDNFVAVKEQELDNQQTQQAKLAIQKAHMQRFIDRFRCNAKRAALVQSRIKAMKRLGDVNIFVESQVQFHFPQAYPDDYEHDKLKPIIELKNVDFQYDSNKLSSFKLQNLNLKIFSDSRICICGANGIGKSTVLKLISQYLKPSKGEIEVNQKIHQAIFWQHHEDQLNLNISPIDTLKSLYPEGTEEQYRAHLSRFGIQNDQCTQVIRTLSGGQKSRVSLSLLTFRDTPEVLILDEITNHLDLETKESLIDALQEYNGAIIMVSHDGPFLSSVTDEMYIIDENGTLQEFDGTFDDYKEILRRQFNYL